MEQRNNFHWPEMKIADTACGTVIHKVALPLLFVSEIVEELQTLGKVCEKPCWLQN